MECVVARATKGLFHREKPVQQAFRAATLGAMLCHEIDFLTSMRELRAANANASTYASADLRVCSMVRWDRELRICLECARYLTGP